MLSADVSDSLKSNVDSQFMVDKDGWQENLYYIVKKTEKVYKVIVLFKPKSLSNYDQSCGKSHKCSGSSKCIKFPYSTEEQCQCPPGWDGTLCNERSNTSFSRTLDTLMTETAKVPALSDVYFELQDTREEMQNGFADVGKALIQMKNFIGKELGKLSTSMNKLFKISNFENRYRDDIKKMSTAIATSGKVFDMFNDKSKYSVDPRRAERNRKDALEKAEYNRKNMPDWELWLDNMFYGKSRFEITTIEPLMLLVIDLYKENACKTKYKEHIDQIFRKFVLLQSDLLALHASSLFVLDMDTTDIAEKYKKTLADQVCLFIFLDIFIHFRCTLIKRKPY